MSGEAQRVRADEYRKAGFGLWYRRIVVQAQICGGIDA